MKKIAVITTSRADYGIYTPLLKLIERDSDLDLTCIALGMHISSTYGHTVDQIRDDGYRVLASEEDVLLGNSALDISKSMGETSLIVSKIMGTEDFDLIFCLGDRFEMFAAVSAMVPFGIPIAHIHGGELSFGALDEKFRHALTKLSDYHFTSCEEHRMRVIRMGAMPERAFNVGSLSLDNINENHLISKLELEKDLGIKLEDDFYLVTYHPATISDYSYKEQIEEFISALMQIEGQFIITMSNADEGGRYFRERLIELDQGGNYSVFESLGSKRYLSMMKLCSIVIGNSSSGIIEAASFNKPVLNIGPRQKGRATSGNVVHSGICSSDIVNGLREAKGLIGQKFTNIYKVDNSAQKVIDILKNIKAPKLQNDFYDGNI